MTNRNIWPFFALHDERGGGATIACSLHVNTDDLVGSMLTGSRALQSILRVLLVMVEVKELNLLAKTLVVNDRRLSQR